MLLWRWLYPRDRGGRPRQEALTRSRVQIPRQCRVKKADDHEIQRAARGISEGVMAVLESPSFEFRPSQIGGLLDIRKRQGQWGYGALPIAFEEKWATVRYLDGMNRSMCKLNRYREDRRATYSWNDAGLLTAMLLRVVATHDALNHKELDVGVPAQCTAREFRAMVRGVDAMAQTHRCARLYSLFATDEFVTCRIHQSDRPVVLTQDRRPKVVQARVDPDEWSAHQVMIVVENGRLYHFDPHGDEAETQHVVAYLWKTICRHTRKVKYGGDLIALGAPSCTAVHGGSPQDSEPFCVLWCCCLAFVLGVNPQRSARDVLEYFKLKAATRAYLKTKIFHFTMYLMSVLERYGGTFCHLDEHDPRYATGVRHLQQKLLSARGRCRRLR